MGGEREGGIRSKFCSHLVASLSKFDYYHLVANLSKFDWGAIWCLVVSLLPSTYNIKSRNLTALT